MPKIDLHRSSCPRHGNPTLTRLQARRWRRRGAATVELAVLLPLLMFLFLLAVDWARVFYVTQIVQNCAYSGALYASQTASASTGAAAAAQQAALAEGISLSPALAASQVSYTPPDSNNNITVTVTYPFSTITPFPAIPHTTTITRTVTMVVAP